MFTIDDMTAPATEDEYMTVINGQPFDLRQVKKVSWKGGKSYGSFYNAETWTLNLKDGTKTKVKVQDVEDHAHHWLTEITFPG